MISISTKVPTQLQVYMSTCVIKEKNKIERIIRQGLFSLSETLYQHWPLPETDFKNEISEANLVIHLAHHFIYSNFLVFSEYRINKKEHIDLYLLSPDNSYHLAIECKRYLANNIASVLSDLKRMSNLSLDKKRYSAIVFLTQKKDIFDWWICEDKKIAPNNARSKTQTEWQNLQQFIEDNKVICGHFAMSHHGINNFFHMALYGIFENKNQK